MKRLLLTLSFIIPIAFAGNAQYTFTDTSGTYTSLDTQTRIMLTDSSVWDDEALVAPIGFNFSFGSRSFDSILLSTNGSIFFFQGCPDSSVSLAPQLLPFSIDLVDRGDFAANLTSPISYETSGSSGNRIFKLEWSRAGFWDGGLNDSLSFQVWLHESNGVVEYRFGPGNISDSSVFDLPPLCALIDKTDCDTAFSGVIVSNDPDNPTDTFLDQSLIYDFADYLRYALNWIPSNGKIYRFMRNTTSTGELEGLTEPEIFPNPNVTGSLTLRLQEGSTIQEVMVYTTNGELVKRHVNNSSSTTVDVTGLPPGLYILEIKTKEQAFTRKLIRY